MIGQPASDSPRLAAAFLRQRRVELALDAVFAVPGRLAVTGQQQSRGRRFGGDRKLWGLRARGSDLDIYTNFSSTTDRSWTDLGSRICRHTARSPTSLFARSWNPPGT